MFKNILKITSLGASIALGIYLGAQISRHRLSAQSEDVLELSASDPRLRSALSIYQDSPNSGVGSIEIVANSTFFDKDVARTFYWYVQIYDVEWNPILDYTYTNQPVVSAPGTNHNWNFAQSIPAAPGIYRAHIGLRENRSYRVGNTNGPVQPVDMGFEAFDVVVN